MGKVTFTARLLAGGESDAWDTLAEEHGCVFDTWAWTSLFGPGLHRYGLYDRGDQLRGGFCLFEERRFGLRVVRNPPFTRQIGPFYEPRASNSAARSDEQRSVVHAMATCVSQLRAPVVSLGLSLGVDDCLPFFWSGYKVVPHYTYRLDLTQPEDKLLSGMLAKRRNNVRKAVKDGVVADQVTDTGAFRDLVVETFARQHKAFPVSAMDAILHRFAPGYSSFCHLSRERGETVAGVFVVHDARTAYYLMGGYREKAHHGAGALAMQHAILEARTRGLLAFDFEGSVVPPIEKYFREFGGQLTPVFGVYKAWLPLEMGLKVVKRQMF